MGFPQGSILVPLFFLVSINGNVKFSCKIKSNLFADNTSVYLSDEKVYNPYILINVNLDKKKLNKILAMRLALNVDNIVSFLLFLGKKHSILSKTFTCVQQYY